MFFQREAADKDLTAASISQETNCSQELSAATSMDSEDDTNNKNISRSIENLVPFQVGDMVEIIDGVKNVWFTAMRNIYFDKDVKEHVFIEEYKGFDSKNTKSKFYEYQYYKKKTSSLYKTWLN